MYVLIYNERVRLTEWWLICWLEGGTGWDDQRHLWISEGGEGGGGDLHTHCSTEVIEQVPERSLSLGSLFPNYDI